MGDNEMNRKRTIAYKPLMHESNVRQRDKEKERERERV